jgi:polysaccharide deacetylase 2 family uncharacterized protein YibQ
MPPSFWPARALFCETVNLRILALLFGLCAASLQAQSLPPAVAIIIDDIGYQKVDPDIIRLPYALTVAVMPFTPKGHEMALLAQQHGKEIMLHMPMEAVAQNHLLGKGALRRTMNKQQVQQALRQALDNVPQASGINNHMGSLFTALPEPMDWVIEVAAERQLYFIDSKTTGHSVVSQKTKAHGVRSRSRDVFLDNDKSYKALDRQFNLLIQIARQHGHAVAIGHPYPETYRYLKKNLPRLSALGIKVVPASALLDLPDHQAGAVLSATGKSATSNKQQSTRQQSAGSAANNSSEIAVAAKPTSADTAPAAEAATTDAVLQQPATGTVPATLQELPPELQVLPELLPWHPPYLPHLPGMDTPPPSAPPEPAWRRFIPVGPTEATPASHTGLLLLR